MSKITDNIDGVIMRIHTNIQPYYGLYVEGKLCCNTSMRVYMRAGQLKSALLKRFGYQRWNNNSPEGKTINQEIKDYMEELLNKKIIEIKQV